MSSVRSDRPCLPADDGLSSRLYLEFSVMSAPRFTCPFEKITSRGDDDVERGKDDPVSATRRWIGRLRRSGKIALA